MEFKLYLHKLKSTEFRSDGDIIVAAIGKNSYKDGKLRINKIALLKEIDNSDLSLPIILRTKDLFNMLRYFISYVLNLHQFLL